MGGEGEEIRSDDDGFKYKCKKFIWINNKLEKAAGSPEHRFKVDRF